jgi:hypothetical protein
MLLNDLWVIEKIREEIKKFLELNKSKNTTYQNLWDTEKVVQRGKLLALSAYIKNRMVSSK